MRCAKGFVFLMCASLCLAGCTKSGTDFSETLPPAEQTAEPAPAQMPEPRLLAYAETPLLDQDENRVHNINLAVHAINEYVLLPGAVFSFNEAVGERTPERGYRDAAVIINRERETDCGGGVCQVSTTVYQAADKAGFPILERHNHQKDVGYADVGTDAAVDYGFLDMRFKNNTAEPVKLNVSVGGGVIAAAIYTHPS